MTRQSIGPLQAFLFCLTSSSIMCTILSTSLFFSLASVYSFIIQWQTKRQVISYLWIDARVITFSVYYAMSFKSLSGKHSSPNDHSTDPSQIVYSLFCISFLSPIFHASMLSDSITLIYQFLVIFMRLSLNETLQEISIYAVPESNIVVKTLSNSSPARKKSCICKKSSGLNQINTSYTNKQSSGLHQVNTSWLTSQILSFDPLMTKFYC